MASRLPSFLWCSPKDGSEEESLENAEEEDEPEEEDHFSQVETRAFMISDSGESKDLEQLRVRVDVARRKVKETEAKFDRVNKYWATRKANLRTQLDESQVSIRTKEIEVYNLKYVLKFGMQPPTGPMWLQFVDGHVFIILCASVMTSNMFMLIYQFNGSKIIKHTYVMDSCFLIFYIVEFGLRAIRYKSHLLFARFKQAWHNWLDLVLIITGILCIWVLPLLGSHGKVVEALRLFRLARFLWVFHALCDLGSDDCAWVKEDFFQQLVMCAIGFSTFLMGFEIEYPQYSMFTLMLEHLLLAFFVFEILGRIICDGTSFFIHIANWFDFVLVGGGVGDLWLVQLMGLVQRMFGEETSAGQSVMGQVMRLLRVARLLRILRLVRLVKAIPPLFNLIRGVVKAMQGMFWVMVLTMVVLYISALVGVKLIGPKGLLVAPLGEEFADVSSHARARALRPHGGGDSQDDTAGLETVFPNMFDGIFNMFKAMQCDLESFDPLFDWSPSSKYIIMVYVVVTNWAIFSILTAVVTDEMQKVTNGLQEQHDVEERAHKNKVLVAKMFDDIDQNNDGVVSKEEFEDLLADKERTIEICEYSGIDRDVLQEYFEILSHEAGHEFLLSRKEFEEGLAREGKEVNTHSLRKLEKRLDDMDQRVSTGLERLASELGNVLVGTRTPCNFGTPQADGSHARSFQKPPY